MNQDLVTVKEAAAILGVDRAIVYREKGRGRLTPAKQQRQGKMNRMYFARSDVEALRALRDTEVQQ